MCKWAIFHMLSKGSQVVGMIKQARFPQEIYRRCRFRLGHLADGGMFSVEHPDPTRNDNFHGENYDERPLD